MFNIKLFLNLFLFSLSASKKNYFWFLRRLLWAQIILEIRKHFYSISFCIYFVFKNTILSYNFYSIKKTWNSPTCETVSSTEMDDDLQPIDLEIFLETTSLTLLRRRRALSKASGPPPRRLACKLAARLFLR